MGIGALRRVGFLLPLAACCALVAGWPLARTIGLSFTDAKLLSEEPAKWVGWSNYAWILADADWWSAVRMTLAFSLISVLLETVLGLLIALVLNLEFRGRGWLRAAVLVPWAIPTVVSARMWTWMLHDVYGVANDLLLKAHLIQAPLTWLVEDRLTFAALVAADVWKTTPFMALLLLAGLQGIPKDVIEAARLDSPSRTRVLFQVVLPLLRPAIVVAVVFRLLDALRIFDLVYVFTGNRASTATMSIYARNQLVAYQEVGLGSAASTLIFAVILGLTAFYLVLSRSTVLAEGGSK